MNRRTLGFSLALVLGVTAGSAPRDARAQNAADSAARTEAGERFDRGLRLFNAGDTAGALVEFRRAYELVQNVVVLYNIGLVYAQMGRAVDATDALDRVVANPGSLSPERLALARKARDEQAARIAEVGVDANVADARIEVDSIEAGKTPLAAPLRVTSGTHVVGVIAPGYSPQRKEVAIAGGQRQDLKFELVAMQGRLAHVEVKTHLPGADVFADDQRIGITPLSASVTLPPGAHRVELRRAGYTTASADVTLGDGAIGEVALEPQEDTAAPETTKGLLAVDASETRPILTVDGRAHGVYASAIRLAEGPHHVLVERGDFEPFERDVTIAPGKTTTVRVVLEPTPDFRARYSARAHAQRTWGIAGVAAGGALLVGGGFLAYYDQTQRHHWDGVANQLNAKIQFHSGDASCDPADNDSGTTHYAAQCLAPITAANSHIADANTRDYFAWSAIGVGAAALTAGIVLLVVNDDPDKYDRAAPQSAGTSVLRVLPTIWSARGGGGAGLVGTF